MVKLQAMKESKPKLSIEGYKPIPQRQGGLIIPLEFKRTLRIVFKSFFKQYRKRRDHSSYRDFLDLLEAVGMNEEELE